MEICTLEQYYFNNLMTERLQKLIEMNEKKESDFLLFAIAKEYEADAQVEKALDCYAQLVVKYSNYVGTYYHYASLLQEQDKKTEASSIIERGIEICTIQGDRHAASELAFLLETEED